MLKNRVMRTNQEIRQFASAMLKGNLEYSGVGNFGIWCYCIVYKL